MPTATSTSAAELYQIATRVYLARASRCPWDPPARLDSLIDETFAGPAQFCGSCEHFFPLLILACEARKEEHRTVILNLMERTARDTRIRSIQGVKNAVLSVWVQQDLNADSDLLENYVGIISAAISMSSSVPSFA